MRPSISTLIIVAFLPVLTACLPAGLPAVTPSPASTEPAPAAATATVPPATATITVTPTETSPDAFPASAAIQKMQRGINMGNTLEAPREGEWGFRIEREHFRIIRAAGFDAVRLPTRWSAHAQPEAPYTIEPAFFARLDEVIGWALEEDLVVVLNIHHYEEMATEPQAHRERFLALWRQIAERYKDYPPTLLFELMNEPNGALSARLWNEFVRESLAVIRESNPTRNLIVGGVSWNAYDQLRLLALPRDDRHLIATFHYYLPFEFTHQGAEWAGPAAQQWLGTPWNGTDEEKAEINRHFTLVEAWSKQQGIPVYLGEFGAYSKADMPSRIRWTQYVREQAEARGFAWAYWEFGAGFGAYDRASQAWREELLRALIP
ncbi:MAG: glycoside hydrolase family 5 protein [Anaerolineales bacterium]|nr:glycoside hydrolase family 5 protein [Anaerolineales bacterium]MCX7755645.1 glycoside hydrolase family 5 protein [Anaerolineales bacterium]MDW8278949.1 glycoside hydrolase family 5 protein [Anaerolineales bacterium]